MAETAASWRVVSDGPARDPEAGVAGDFDLLDAVVEGRAPATLRLWENRRCLVVSRRDARLPGFAEARDSLARDGWPVVVRDSGGTAVPHGPGILLVGMAYPVSGRSATRIEDGYARLCGLMIDALARLGVHAACRSVPAAFCDGRYNLAVGPQKIAGTAQRWRRRRSGGKVGQAVLSHALLLVSGDAAEMTAAVNRFYRLAGADIRYDVESVTTLARCLGEPADLMTPVRAALADAAAEVLPADERVGAHDGAHDGGDGRRAGSLRG